MKIKFKLNNHTVMIEPYKTQQEKEILLCGTYDNYNLDSVLDILGVDNVDEFTEDEKKVLLYKFREYSVDSEVGVQFKCSHCGTVNDNAIDTTGFHKPSERNDDDIKKLSQEFDEENLAQYVNLSQEDIDELDINDYEELKERVIANQNTIDFKAKSHCINCGSVKNVNLGDTKFIIDVMSEHTIMTLYQEINQLVFFGHYTKADVDNMLPFERTLFIGITNKIKEDLGA